MTGTFVCVYILFLFVAALNAEKVAKESSDRQAEVREVALLLTESRNLIKDVRAIQQGHNLFKRVNISNTPIAFTVRLTKGISNLNAGHQIRFDEIVYNYGNGYNTLTGQFICPQDGVYKFSATMVSQLQEKTFAMMKNAAVLAKFTTGRDGIDQATQSIIVQCYYGDIVSMVPLNQAYSLAVHIQGTSSFSGYKLF